MSYQSSPTAVGVFIFFVALVLGISFVLGRKAKSARGFFAAHGQIHWFVNGIAFAGDYLSAASFLGICGMIAFFGYDGFLYSIGYLAGWIVALFVIAEPLKRLGRFTFADALDNRFGSRGIKFAAALSTLVVSIFYLIPQMVGAGALIKPLLGFSHHAGVLTVGVVVILIVVTAGMVSTTYVQFIKGTLLVVFCAVLTAMILGRGLTVGAGLSGAERHEFRIVPAEELLAASESRALPESGGWAGKPYVRFEDSATRAVEVWRRLEENGRPLLGETQTLRVLAGGGRLVNGFPEGEGDGRGALRFVGHVRRLPGGQERTGPLGPLEYFRVLEGSEVVLWGSETIAEADGGATTVYYPKPTPGSEVLVPGASPTFAGVRRQGLAEKLDFLSLMLALFAGTASLPHILIRYYTVKDQAAARKSTVVGIASIGFFYILTLYLGLGAMTSGHLDVTNSNMAAPLLARSFGELPFAVISAIAFTTVLGTVSGLIMAASGAVAHDLIERCMGRRLEDHQKVRAGKWVAVVVGASAMALGIAFERMNVSFLVGWAFNIAASANLPALILVLFWRGATRQGVTASILVGMASSLAWVLASAQAYKDVYGLPPEDSLVPFSQPGIVTIPLGFAVLVVVSFWTRRRPAFTTPDGPA
jgi:cation/acetate symporter